MDEEQARKRIEDLRGFYAHLAAYVPCNLFLLAVNLLTGTATLWFLFPLMGWSIGLAIHAVVVFWMGSDWEARKLEELTGLKETRDDVQRLSERTDALVKILASVDWDRIDPELVGTRSALESAQGRLASLRAGAGGASAAEHREVAREVERLEAFVTSPRFDYLERASRPN
jgi:hypothetical protein